MIGSDELFGIWGMVFYRPIDKKITIVAVYVDDIIITGDDEEEIKRVKGCLSNEFE